MLYDCVIGQAMGLRYPMLPHATSASPLLIDTLFQIVLVLCVTLLFPIPGLDCVYLTIGHLRA